MTNTYKVTGMTCHHCVKSVTNILKDVHGVQSVQVTLEPPLARLTASRPISLEELNRELETYSTYRLEEMAKV